MADSSRKSSPNARLVAFVAFIGFETAAYFFLHFITSSLGETDQYQANNTIVSNWVKTTTFVVGHLVLSLVAMLWLSNRLPRQYRGLVQGWFYVALLMSFVLLGPLLW